MGRKGKHLANVRYHALCNVKIHAAAEFTCTSAPSADGAKHDWGACRALPKQDPLQWPLSLLRSATVASTWSICKYREGIARNLNQLKKGREFSRGHPGVWYRASSIECPSDDPSRGPGAHFILFLNLLSGRNGGHCRPTTMRMAIQPTDYMILESCLHSSSSASSRLFSARTIGCPRREVS